jgi:hypothetical protein
MKKKIIEEHLKDENGNPTGGLTTGIGLNIQWQDGPLGRGPERLGPNGAQIEEVLQAAIGRLQHFQASKFSCRENAVALTHMETALLWLQKRTADREARGVEGTHEK